MRCPKRELDDSAQSRDRTPPSSRVQRCAPLGAEALRPIVEAAVRRLTGRNDSEYEDLVQSALEVVLGAMRARREDDAHVVQWVSAVARNVAIDKLRARTRERRVIFGEIECEPASERSVGPEHLTHVRRELQRVDCALQDIGHARAMVVYLHDALGYQLAEVAEALALTPAAAQSRLVRGRRALLRGMQRKLPVRLGRGS